MHLSGAGCRRADTQTDLEWRCASNKALEEFFQIVGHFKDELERRMQLQESKDLVLHVTSRGSRC